MVTLVCDNLVAEDKIEEIRQYYAEVVEYTRQQPGCIMYDVYQDRAKTNCLVFVEAWRSDEDLRTHLEDPVFLEMFKRIELCLIEPERTRMLDHFLK